jgi:hypothetical protein
VRIVASMRNQPQNSTSIKNQFTVNSIAEVVERNPHGFHCLLGVHLPVKCSFPDIAVAVLMDDDQSCDNWPSVFCNIGMHDDEIVRNLCDL